MKTLIAAAVFAGIAVSVSAQAALIDRFFDNTRLRKQLQLTDEEIRDLQKVWDESHRKLQLSKADRNVKTTELKKLLLENPVNMSAVEKTLREATDLDYEIRLAQINLALKMRGILGDKRWADAQKYLRDARTRFRNQKYERRRPPRFPAPPDPSAPWDD